MSKSKSKTSDIFRNPIDFEYDKLDWFIKKEVKGIVMNYTINSPIRFLIGDMYYAQYAKL
mgnify:CR=1 FL=1